MASHSDPTARIFEGLLHALARYGVQRTSMTDVSTETGISRGTLYRYFSTKEDLLGGLSDYLIDDLGQNLHSSIEGNPETSQRMHVTLEGLRLFRERRPSLEQLALLEPSFVIHWYQSKLEEMLALVAQVITPAIEPKRIKEGPGTPEIDQRIAALANLIVRLALSFQFLPPSNEDSSITVQMASVLDSYAGRVRGTPASEALP